MIGIGNGLLSLVESPYYINEVPTIKDIEKMLKESEKRAQVERCYSAYLKCADGKVRMCVVNETKHPKEFWSIRHIAYKETKEGIVPCDYEETVGLLGKLLFCS